MDYNPPSFDSSSPLSAFKNAPRFGHTSDFSQLITPDKTDYYLGTIGVGCIIFSLFILWIITLFIFMMIGPKKVGMLAGFRMVDTKSREKVCRTVNVVRSMVVLSCMCMITMAILAYFYGLKPYKMAAYDAIDVSEDILASAKKGEKVSTLLTKSGPISATIRDLLVDELDDQFCVNSYLDDLTSKNFTKLRTDTVTSLNGLGDFYADEFNELANPFFSKMKKASTEGVDYFKLYGVKEWQALTFLIPMTVLPFLMMTGTIFAWAGKPISWLNCILTWLTLPIFILFVAASWLLCSFIAIVAVMNADVCFVSDTYPDTTFLNLIAKSKLQQQSPMLFESLNFWINKCVGSAPEVLNIANKYGEEFDSSFATVQLLIDAIDEVGFDQMSSICGGKNFSVIHSYLVRMGEFLSAKSDNCSALSDILSCENMNGFYTKIAYDTVCTTFPESGLWSFSTTLIASIFGMIIITFRSAWLKERTKGIPSTPSADFSHLSKSQHEYIMPVPSYIDRRSIREPYDLEHFIEDDPEGIISDKAVADKDDSLDTDNQDTLELNVTSWEKISVADDKALKQVSPSPKDPGFKIY